MSDVPQNFLVSPKPQYHYFVINVYRENEPELSLEGDFDLLPDRNGSSSTEQTPAASRQTSRQDKPKPAGMHFTDPFGCLVGFCFMQAQLASFIQ